MKPRNGVTFGAMREGKSTPRESHAMVYEHSKLQLTNQLLGKSWVCRHATGHRHTQ